jgi:hypothetical protein
MARNRRIGGQNDFKSDILIPSSHPSTKPGQVHAVAYRSIATHAPISRCAIATRHYGGHGKASARARGNKARGGEMPPFRMIEEEPLYDIRRLTYAHGVRDACPSTEARAGNAHSVGNALT